jgi:hypothetical protein
MRDPSGVCIRRCSFSHARSRVSRAEPSKLVECNSIRPSDMNDEPYQHPLPVSDDEICSLPDTCRLDPAINASAGWLNDAGKNKPLASFVPCD